MSTNKTEHYGLHLWEPEDQFVRAEFNENSEKTDAAIRAAESRADSFRDALEPVSYNLYNLMLQQYYNGKQTGYKKALLFDGFSNMGSIAALNQALVLGNNRLTLRRPAPANVELANAPGYILPDYAKTTEITSKSVTATGGSQLSRIKIFWRAGKGHPDSSSSISFTIYINNVLRQTLTKTLSFTAAPQSGYVTLSPALTVREGDVIHFKATPFGSPWVLGLVNLSGSIQAYGAFDLRTAGSLPATVTSVAASLPACRRAVGWVRHIGGSLIGLTLNTGGVRRTMTRTASRAAVSLQGEACTEVSYRLDASLPAGETAVDLTFTLNGGENEAALLDYGVVLL